MIWRIAGPHSPERLDDVSFSELRAGEGAGDERGPARRGQLEDLPRLASAGSSRARAGIGRPTTWKRAVAAVERVGEVDPLREGQRHPVREAEVRVGLGQRGRDAHRRGGEDHRPGDVPAAAEDDVGPAAAEDRAARARRDAGPVDGARTSCGDGCRGKPLIRNVSSS